VKKYSTILAIKEIQMKVTLKFHLISVRMAMIKKTAHQCWLVCGGCGEELSTYTVGGNVS
jgi:hypothetical protein